MHISLTRNDIKQHAEALRNIEAFEEWRNGRNSACRYIVLKQKNSQMAVSVDCGHCCTGSEQEEEAIFRKHMDAAVEEALAYWRKRANLHD
jgi:hypothetical protein